MTENYSTTDEAPEAVDETAETEQTELGEAADTETDTDES